MRRIDSVIFLYFIWAQKKEYISWRYTKVLKQRRICDYDPHDRRIWGRNDTSIAHSFKLTSTELWSPLLSWEAFYGTPNVYFGCVVTRVIQDF
jgi:hypothetical protein